MSGMPGTRLGSHYQGHGHSQSLKVKSFVCITKKNNKASIVKFHETVNNNEMVYHN